MIRNYSAEMEPRIREFLLGHFAANYTHDPAWLPIIRETYQKIGTGVVFQPLDDGPIHGFGLSVLMATPLGRKSVCLPYLDYGGPVADSQEVMNALLNALLVKAKTDKTALEIRSLEPLPNFPDPKNEKVGMVLDLQGKDAEGYWKSLDARVRNQVRKAEKSGVTVLWGKEDRLEDFYQVFAVNMRDLGSPVHAKQLFTSVLKHFPGAEIGTAHRAGKCIGGLFRIHWKNALVIPWASTLREERIHNPNNALYWESIQFAFAKQCVKLDFGRSSKEEGTYRFKKQWLADEQPLNWYQFDASGKLHAAISHVGKGGLQWAPAIWSRLPMGIANYFGPRIRGFISA